MKLKMNYRFLVISFLYLITVGCEQSKRSENLDLNSFNKYKNTGFALIYENNLNIKKKIDDRSLYIFKK